MRARRRAAILRFRIRIASHSLELVALTWYRFLHTRSSRAGISRCNSIEERWMRERIDVLLVGRG